MAEIIYSVVFILGFLSIIIVIDVIATYDAFCKDDNSDFKTSSSSRLLANDMKRYMEVNNNERNYTSKAKKQ